MISFPTTVVADHPPADGSRIDRADVHVWSIDLRERPGSPPTTDRCLSKAERDRAEKFQLPEHRRRYVECRTALRQILGGYLRQEAADVAIETVSGGKPRLAPRSNPLDLRFNLSHSGSTAVLVVGVGVEVGVDIEAVRPIRAFETMLARCLSPAERDAVLHQPSSLQAREFLRYWTHKEAYLKAVGAGIRRPLTSIVVDLNASPYWRVFDHSGMQDPPESWLVEMDPGGDIVGAVAWLDGARRGIEAFAWEPTAPAAARSIPAQPRFTSETIRDWLVEYLARHLAIPAGSVDTSASFESFALDSATAMEMTGDLERWLGRSVDPTLVFDYPTIEKFADHLAGGD